MSLPAREHGPATSQNADGARMYRPALHGKGRIAVLCFLAFKSILSRQWFRSSGGKGLQMFVFDPISGELVEIKLLPSRH